MSATDLQSSLAERAQALAAKPVIEVRGLDAHYGDVQILFGVSLAVYEGEIMVIMGGSGSGKSTLLRHIIGLEHPSAGSLELLGQDI